MKNISIKPTLGNIIDKNDQILDLLSADMGSHEVISDIILWESENLISPNIEGGQIFDKKMKNIASKLLPYWDFSNIHFIISHSRKGMLIIFLEMIHFENILQLPYEG